MCALWVFPLGITGRRSRSARSSSSSPSWYRPESSKPKPGARDLLRPLQLGEEERHVDITRRVRAAEVDPAVLVAAGKTSAGSSPSPASARVLKAGSDGRVLAEVATHLDESDTHVGVGELHERRP